MLINLNGFTINDDGETFTPAQMAIGEGAQIILRGDGSAEFAIGAVGFRADGTPFFPEPNFQEIVYPQAISTHLLRVQDAAGHTYFIPAILQPTP